MLYVQVFFRLLSYHNVHTKTEIDYKFVRNIWASSFIVLVKIQYLSILVNKTKDFPLLGNILRNNYKLITIIYTNVIAL